MTTLDLLDTLDFGYYKIPRTTAFSAAAACITTLAAFSANAEHVHDSGTWNISKAYLVTGLLSHFYDARCWSGFGKYPHHLANHGKIPNLAHDVGWIRCDDCFVTEHWCCWLLVDAEHWAVLWLYR